VEPTGVSAPDCPLRHVREQRAWSDASAQGAPGAAQGQGACQARPGLGPDAALFDSAFGQGLGRHPAGSRPWDMRMNWLVYLVA
jgi:hypothetical protein